MGLNSGSHLRKYEHSENKPLSLYHKNAQQNAKYTTFYRMGTPQELLTTTDASLLLAFTTFILLCMPKAHQKGKQHHHTNNSNCPTHAIPTIKSTYPKSSARR
jgi:hypothetical protein